MCGWATPRSRSRCWPSACAGALRYRTDKNVFLQCDGALTVQDQMDVMDRLKDGGAEKVAIVAKFPERR